MPHACPLCQSSFKKVKALQAHWDATHHHARCPTISCAKCNKPFMSQQGLDQHNTDKHSFIECRYCDREFTTELGRDVHEKVEHPPTFPCEYCDLGFKTDQGRLAHQNEKHPPTFKCEHCIREFKTDESRLAHQKEMHSPTFKCEYCILEFMTDDGRLAHQKKKHPPIFRCYYCDRQLSAEYARASHEEAEHSVFKCQYACTRTFNSREARQQHEDSPHNFKCNLCGANFSKRADLQHHERTMPHYKCSYCTTKHFTTALKKAHEVSCGSNPAHRPPLTHSDQSGSSSGVPKPTETVEEESSLSDEGSEPPASPSPSSEDGGELFHSTSALPSTDANSEGATVTQSGACTHSLDAYTCSICMRAPGDAESVISTNEIHRDVSQDHYHVIFQCTPCLKVFETEEVFRDHVCAFRTTMPRPHCQVCYTQFDDELSLQEHLGLEAFSCQFCLTRCCSDEMLQDHLLLSHPACGKCGKSFADNLALCAHVESDHPVVVCWDCGGIVVEMNSLELHYAESSSHPSCGFCGVGKRNATDMAEHVKHVHATSAALQDPSGCNEMINASPDEESFVAETERLGADREGTAGPPLEELDHAPLSSNVDIGPLGGPGDEPHSSALQRESSRSSSPQPPMPPQVEHVDEVAGNTNGEESPDVSLRHASPSPTPSEHGSNASRLLASKTTISATNNDTRPPSPVSSVSAGSVSDLSTQSSPSSSSSNSVVFVSVEGIPEYIRDNRAVLVATSAGSPSSSSSLDMESLMAAGARASRVSSAEDARSGTGTRDVAYRLHCRICLRDPCEDMTATICGHLFCKRCITQAVVAKSECPVCKSATLLYCLFKLDLSV
ncbi:hypothetical protein V8E55_007056 [Tylopilus felleus]